MAGRNPLPNRDHKGAALATAMRPGAVLVLLGLLCAAALSAQGVPELIGGLASERWQDRSYYYQQLKRPENSAPATNSALIRLLTAENRLVFRASQQEMGVAAAYGEGFERYVDDLVETVMLIANQQPDRPDIWPALLGGYLAPDSAHSRWIALQGARGVPVLLKMVSETSAGDWAAGRRGDALLMLSEIADREHKGQTALRLKPETLREIMAAIHKGLADPLPVVRIKAVRALWDIGTREDLAALDRLAAGDSDRTPEGNPGNEYSVRDAARGAAQSIRSRLSIPF